MSETPTACILIIGNEILSGRTQDSNLSFLGASLARMGIPVKEARVIPDVEEEIMAAVNECRQKYTYIFTTGGIGPTHDDITSAAIAKAFGVELQRHEPSVKKMRERYTERLNAARLKMAYLPAGAEPIMTRVTSAPGFVIENVHAMAGVPSIAEAMFDAVAPTLKCGIPVQSRFIDAYLGEGDIAAELAVIQTMHPNVDIGSYPFFRVGKVGLSIVARGTDKDAIDTVIERVAEIMRERGVEPVPDTELS